MDNKLQRGFNLWLDMNDDNGECVIVGLENFKVCIHNYSIVASTFIGEIKTKYTVLLIQKLTINWSTVKITQIANHSGPLTLKYKLSFTSGDVSFRLNVDPLRLRRFRRMVETIRKTMLISTNIRHKLYFKDHGTIISFENPTTFTQLITFKWLSVWLYTVYFNRDGSTSYI